MSTLRKHQTVLVTGATGFTGGHLAKRLVQEGYHVRALVRPTSQCDDLRRLGVELVLGDIRDKEPVMLATKDIDVVYHIAAIFRSENVYRAEMFDVNVHGTRNLLEAASRAGVKRFVHCSTIGVHGDIKHPPGNEESPYGPGDHYQESKVEGEKLVLDFMKSGNLPIVVFRPGGIYGPGDLRFLKLFKAIKKRTFIMLGSGEVPYQMTYIDDLIEGILLCGTREKAIGKVYILTGDAPVTLNELVRLIADSLRVPPPRFRFPVMPVYVAGFLCELLFKPLGLNPPIYRRRVDFFRKARSFDISKAKAELNFHPKVDLKAGFGLTVEWYAENSLL